MGLLGVLFLLSVFKRDQSLWQTVRNQNPFRSWWLTITYRQRRGPLQEILYPELMALELPHRPVKTCQTYFTSNFDLIQLLVPF